MQARQKSRLIVALAVALTLGSFLFGALRSYSILGLHDAEIYLRADERLEHPDRVARTLRWRLAAGDEYADIAAGAGEVSVLIDQKLATHAVDLATWQGGVTAHRLDPAFDLPETESTLVRVEDADASSGRRYVGNAEGLASALKGVELPGGRAVAYAPVEGTKLLRTVVYFKENALPAEVPVLDERVTDDGRGVDLRLASSAADAVEALGDGSTFVLKGGKAVVLFHPRVVGDHVISSCGEDLRAYHRALRYVELFASGPTPPLAVESKTKAPRDFALGALHLAIPLLVAATWFAILRRFDRAQPEPWWLVLATGGIAMAISPLTFVLRAPLTGTDWGDPHLADHAGRLEAFFPTLLAYCLRAGMVEELMKLLPVLALARWRRDFDEPIDGIVYTAAAAIGFSCVEEFGYLQFGRLHPSLLVARATSTPPAHVFFTAVIGYALGQGIGRGKRGIPRVALAYLAAAFLHGLYDTLLTFRPLLPVARAYQVVLLLLFTFLVRRALRGSSAVIAPSKSAKLVRAGSFFGFAFNTAVFAVGVASLREIGSIVPSGSTLTPGEVTAIALTLSVAVALVALRMVSSAPLDVVVDDAGLTFSGVTWPWSTIGAALEAPMGDLFPMRRRVVLDTSKGPFIVGPLSRANAAALLGEIQSRAASARAAADTLPPRA